MDSSSSSSIDPSSSSMPVDAFSGSTKKVEVKTGTVVGITLTMIDTPGLTASAAGTASNAGVLKGIKKAFKHHQPDLVLYVDRWVVFADTLSGKWIEPTLVRPVCSMPNQVQLSCNIGL
eukprot:GHUV01021359.1.p1 GENE.GHUV01021359.1~~GHUV01021359.1.p1  ORF type:complete len:136 (+),score=46.77 GHUV01021359.1:53-409(+)